MQTIQVVLDEQLLTATDDAARRARLNRSALVRDALRQYLKRLHVEDLERRDRAGYEREPDTAADLALWEGAAAWPPD
jgi:metal-responsive CopG/Arc/MetJ family transcriptional regulator